MFEENKKEKTLGVILFIITGILFIYILYYMYNYNIEIEKISKVKAQQQQIVEERKETAKKENYKCFLDGKEIDINTVDLNQYECTIDVENKQVYLTKKQPKINVYGRTHTYAPMPSMY